MEDNLKKRAAEYLVRAKFELGLIAATPGVELSLPPADIVLALARHAAGDWGDLCEEDWQANEDALIHGGRLLSVYHAQRTGERFYVITEADRSATTMLLPAEY